MHRHASVGRLNTMQEEPDAGERSVCADKDGVDHRKDSVVDEGEHVGLVVNGSAVSESVAPFHRSGLKKVEHQVTEVQAK